ncbi:ABC-three component system protein [Arthrobacter rhombi]|uniref:ABC-three component system protein n=1 Tax=Arthrobacter rhombi TaxID=71253 RepID=UPI003FD35C03
MSTSDFEQAWFYSWFNTLCIRTAGNAWEEMVSNAMAARHPGAFIQVDAAGRGDKGCDGYVDGLMLACYGATSPSDSYVENKIKNDYAKAAAHWSNVMKTWAFVHNNANGLPTMVAQTMASMRQGGHPHVIEHWPPQVLWENVYADLDRRKLSWLLGAPPSVRPAGMTYIAECVRSLSRTKLMVDLKETLPVPAKKIEYNKFGPEVVKILTETKNHTHHVRYYFQQSSPGEQYQVSEKMRMKYDGLQATSSSSDEVFHRLCNSLVEEAFAHEGMADVEQQRSAALLLVTHFFESCMIFETPEEVRLRAAAI